MNDANAFLYEFIQNKRPPLIGALKYIAKGFAVTHPSFTPSSTRHPDDTENSSGRGARKLLGKLFTAVYMALYGDIALVTASTTSLGKDNVTVKGADSRRGTSGSDRNRRSRTGTGAGAASSTRSSSSGRATRAWQNSQPSQGAATGPKGAGSSRAASGRKGAKGSGTSSRMSALPGVSRFMNSPRVRRFGLSVLGSYGVVLLFIISVALIVVIVSGAGMSPLPASIASLWMMFNLAPFRFNGTTLGLTPALPAVLMVGFIAWRVRREVADRISIKDVRALVGAYLLTPVVLTIIAWLMLYDASKVFPRVQTPSFGLAFAASLLVNLVALVLGMGQRLIRALLVRRRLPEWLLGSARLAGSYVAWLWLVGAVVTVASLIWHHELLSQTYAITDTTGDAIAVTGLSLLYVPNIAFGALGVLVGGQSSFGPAEVGLFAVHPAQLPPLPILAAMPQSLQHWAFGVLIVLPAAVAVWRVVKFLKSTTTKWPYLIVVVAAVWSALFLMALAWLMGGEVGVFGWAGASWWLTGLLGSMWLVVPGAIVVVAMTGLPSAGGYQQVPKVRAEKFPPKTEQDAAAEDGSAEDVEPQEAADSSEGAEEEPEEVVDGEVVSTSEEGTDETETEETASEESDDASDEEDSTDHSSDDSDEDEADNEPSKSEEESKDS